LFVFYFRTRKGEFNSPYHAYVAALSKFADLKITGLIIEVADTINEVSLSLGAAGFPAILVFTTSS